MPICRWHDCPGGGKNKKQTKQQHTNNQTGKKTILELMTWEITPFHMNEVTDKSQLLSYPGKDNWDLILKVKYCL